LLWQSLCEPGYEPAHRNLAWLRERVSAGHAWRRDRRGSRLRAEPLVGRLTDPFGLLVNSQLM
jgi:hypothetical protein